jgi:hypothetical protein
VAPEDLPERAEAGWADREARAERRGPTPATEAVARATLATSQWRPVTKAAVAARVEPRADLVERSEPVEATAMRRAVTTAA